MRIHLRDGCKSPLSSRYLVFMGRNTISEDRFKFLDTDSKSALSQNRVAQQERTHCESFGHNEDNDAEDALEKFQVFMKCRIREKKNCFSNQCITFI